MTEQHEAPPPDSSREREITFHGRQMWVKRPTESQLLIWQRTVTLLESANEGWSGTEVMNALGRAHRLIDSLLVHRTDITWLEEQMLEGALELPNLAEIIQLTAEAFGHPGQEGNREGRRATAKPKKTARRKASAER